MANTIRHKRSTTASSVPVPGDLSAGEIAINTTDEKLYIKNTGGSVVEVGVAPIIYDSGELTSAVTSFDITGLDLGKMEEYHFVFNLYNASGATSVYYLTANGDHTLGNYITQVVTSTGTTLTSLADNRPLIGYAQHNRNTTGSGKIVITQNLAFDWFSQDLTYIGAIQTKSYAGFAASTLTGNLTSLRITSSAGSAIGIGSRFIIKRKS